MAHILAHAGSSASKTFLELKQVSLLLATIKDFIIINLNLAVWYLCLQECRKVLLQ